MADNSTSWKFGVADFATTEPLANAEMIIAQGFDFIEAGLAKAAAMRETEFQAAATRIAEAGIPVLSMNWFLPPDLKVVGPETDASAQRNFLELALSRANQLGARAVVFGSPGSRTIPDGFPASEAREQFVAFCRLAAEVIKTIDAPIRIAVEHVNHTETNFLNRFDQAFEIVREIDRPQIGLAADFYHFEMESESMEILREAGDLVCAVQLADPKGRSFPEPDRQIPRLAEFFEHLTSINYQGGIAIEATPGSDLTQSCKAAIKALRE